MYGSLLYGRVAYHDFEGITEVAETAFVLNKKGEYVPDPSKITSEQYVFVLMSLTSAFCPAADSMPREIIQKIEGNMPGFKCKVKITMIPQ